MTYINTIIYNEKKGLNQMEQTQNSKNTMRNAGILFFILTILTLPISLVYSYLLNVIPEEYHSLFSILLSQGYLLISAFIYLGVTKTKIGRDLNFKKYKFSSFLLSILVLITASPMSSLLNILSQLFARNDISNTMSDISEKLPFWAGILVIGCLPGFIEELIYRGILYSAFKKHSILCGIIIGSLSFGLMHGNFNQIPYAIYLGVIFTLLVEATGSLASSMILHMMFNGTTAAYLYVLPYAVNYLKENSDKYDNLDLNEQLSHIPTKAELISGAIPLILPAVIGLIISILLLKQIAKMNGKTLNWQVVCERKDTNNFQMAAYEEKHSNNSQKPISAWLIAGWIICILLATLNLLYQ